MKGSYHVMVQNNRLRYEFDIRRNITIIQGDSATGKTTLVQMIALYARLGESSGIDIQCEKKCRTLDSPDWELVLPALHDTIVFLDEDHFFLKSDRFARLAQESDNYFVIMTRENLSNLPYSVEKIYGIHASGKYHDMRRVYNEFYHIYSSDTLLSKVKPDAVIVEDSNSGYDFFHDICTKKRIPCQSAGGKSNLRHALQKTDDKQVLVIADGASIGPEMNELTQFMKTHPGTKCYLPESFEWIILKSGLIDGSAVQELLARPQDYIESREYFNWERFFTHILTHYTKDTYLHYNRHKLNSAYLHDRARDAILAVMNLIDFE